MVRLLVLILVSFLRPSLSVEFLSAILSSVRVWSPTAIPTCVLNAIQVGLVPKKSGEIALMSRSSTLHPSCSTFFSLLPGSHSLLVFPPSGFDFSFLRALCLLSYFNSRESHNVT